MRTKVIIQEIFFNYKQTQLSKTGLLLWTEEYNRNCLKCGSLKYYLAVYCLASFNKRKLRQWAQMCFILPEMQFDSLSFMCVIVKLNLTGGKIRKLF